MLNLAGCKEAREAISPRRRERRIQSASDKRVLFGLGQEDKISSIEIRRRSAIRQEMKNVAADRCLKIDEPAKSGIVARQQICRLIPRLFCGTGSSVSVWLIRAYAFRLA
jgi:hypothetical protein